MRSNPNNEAPYADMITRMPGSHAVVIASSLLTPRSRLHFIYHSFTGQRVRGTVRPSFFLTTRLHLGLHSRALVTRGIGDHGRRGGGFLLALHHSAGADGYLPARRRFWGSRSTGHG